MARPHTHDFSVILLPTNRGQELLDLAEEWTRSWLIDPAIYILPDGVRSYMGSGAATREDPYPPEVRGTALGRNGRREVDLFEELGRHEHDLIRFVAVRSVTPEFQFEEDQDIVLDAVDYYVRLSCPDTTQAVRINLIWAATQVAGGDPEKLLESGWNINVIASPEDRPTALSFDAYTRFTDPERLDGFVLAHTCTAAALWSKIAEGPYDRLEARTETNQLQVQRINLRGVLSDALVLDVARSALEIASKPQSPINDPLHYEGVGGLTDLRLLSEAEIPSAIDRLVEISMDLDDQRLRYSNVDWREDPGKRAIDERQGLKEFGEFARDKIVNLPYFAYDWIRGLFSRKLTETLHGQEGEAVVEYKTLRSSLEQRFIAELYEIEEARKKILVDLETPIPPVRTDVYPRLWEGIRRLSFALLDGSQPPETNDGGLFPGQIPDDPVRGILPDAGLMYPDWRERWTVPLSARMNQKALVKGDGEFSWLDVTDAEAALTQLEQRQDQLRQRRAEQEVKTLTLIQSRERLAEQLEEAEFQQALLEEEIEWLAESIDIEADQSHERVTS